MDVTAEDLAALKLRHKKRVERRAKYLETLTPRQRRTRDDYVAWVRWWKHEYKRLSKTIQSSKAYARSKGINNLETLKITMRSLEKQRFRARTMILARMAAKVDFEMKMEGK